MTNWSERIKRKKTKKKNDLFRCSVGCFCFSSFVWDCYRCFVVIISFQLGFQFVFLYIFKCWTLSVRGLREWDLSFCVYKMFSNYFSTIIITIFPFFFWLSMLVCVCAVAQFTTLSSFVFKMVAVCFRLGYKISSPSVICCPSAKCPMKNALPEPPGVLYYRGSSHHL